MPRLLWKIKRVTSILKNNLLFFLLFCASTTLEAKSLKGYCFESNVSLKAVRSHLSAILSPRDEVFERPSMNCIEVTISSTREELFETWIYKRFKPIRIYRTDGVVENNQTMGQMPMCRMTVERVSRSDSSIDDVSVGSHNKLKNTRSKSNGVSQSSLLLTSGVRGRLRMDDQEVFVTCHVFGTNYRVELSLDSSNSSLSTSVNTTKGSRLNIGQMVEDLNNRSRNIDIKKGVNYQKQKGRAVSDYFLIIQ
jgi:hypothetical protein